MYLVTIKTSFGEQVRQAERLKSHNDKWYWSILPSGGLYKVVAWQKCPEPYKE